MSALALPDWTHVIECYRKTSNKKSTRYETQTDDGMSDIDNEDNTVLHAALYTNN